MLNRIHEMRLRLKNAKPTVVGFLVCAQLAHGAESRAPSGRTLSIPPLARVAGVQAGYSTQEDLARLWGEGKVMIGGHPNSGRLWRVKGTNWTVHTDCFQYSARGLVVDGIELSQEKPLPGAPLAKRQKKEFACLGGVVPGMSRQQVMKFIGQQSLKTTKTDQGLKVQAKGFCLLVQGQFTTWTANLYFKNDHLSGFALSAED